MTARKPTAREELARIGAYVAPGIKVKRKQPPRRAEEPPAGRVLVRCAECGYSQKAKVHQRGFYWLHAFVPPKPATEEPPGGPQRSTAVPALTAEDWERVKDWARWTGQFQWELARFALAARTELELHRCPPGNPCEIAVKGDPYCRARALAADRPTGSEP